MEKPNFDAAALAGATLAAVLANFTDSGPFGFMSLIVGIVLLLILAAYEGPRQRNLLQSIAASAVAALASLLIVGFLAELLINGLEGDLLRNGNVQSEVWGSFLAGAWLALGFIYWVIDFFAMQPKLRPLADVADSKASNK